MTLALHKKQHNKDWPHFSGIFSPTEYDNVLTCMSKNERFNVTEKYDGTNVQVDSDGWASSKTIYLFHKNDRDWAKDEKIQNISVHHLEPVFEQVLQLHLVLQALMGDLAGLVTTSLVGEFILKGTGDCKFDIYHYKSRDMEEGHFYAFGMNLLFSTRANHTFKLQKLGFNAYRSEINKCLVHVPLCKTLEKLMLPLEIKLIPVIKYEHFNAILTDPEFNKQLLDRNIEGYVLTKGNTMFKWKYPKVKNETSTGYLANLRLDLLDITKSSPSKPPNQVMDCLDALLDNVDNYISEENINKSFDFCLSEIDFSKDFDSRFKRASNESMEELNSEIDDIVDDIYLKIRRNIGKEWGVIYMDAKQMFQLTEKIRKTVKKEASGYIVFAKYNDKKKKKAEEKLPAI